MKKNIGFLIYDDVQPMDVIGPWEVFSFWKNILLAPVNLYLIAEKSAMVSCDSGICLQAHCDFNDAPKLNYLVVPGGRGRIKQMHNERLIAFIKNQAAQCEYILSVCTGMFLLSSAGVLKNKSVATYWRAMPELKKELGVHVAQSRIVKDGSIWTSGGVSSGIDLALAFIAEIAGVETAGKVQLLLEYFPDNQLYCSEQTVNTLPPYGGEYKNTIEDLPDYIKQYIRGKK
jgi:cyclohexyl-isocyanide hydratase